MPTHTTLRFEAIGTRWTIDIESTLSPAARDDLETAIHQRIADFAHTYSRFEPDSLCAEIAASAGAYRFPDDSEVLFAFYRQLYDATYGAVTPLIGQLLCDSGYDPTYSFTPAATLTPAPDWDQVMRYDHPTLTTTRPLQLDIGAAGKGYLVDLVGELLQARGIAHFTIDAGGDLLRHTPADSTIRIGLEHPTDPTQAIGVVTLGSGSLCGSSTMRRRWGDRHHIIDPHTTEPVRTILATWARADTALAADGLATALFFRDPAELHKQFDFESCILYSDFSCRYSPGFATEIFIGASA